MPERNYRIEFWQCDDYGNYDWRPGASLFFIPQDPPPCPNAQNNYCSYYYYEEPPITVIEKGADWYPQHYCDSHEDVLAFTNPFSGHLSNMGELTSQNIDVCFNLQSQSWRFHLNVPQIEYYVIIAFCEDHIDTLHLNSINDTSEINGYDCSELLNSLEHHKPYPYALEDGDLLFREIILAHEREHMRRFENKLNDYSFLFDMLLYDFNPGCDAYTDIEDARTKGVTVYQNAFTDKFLNLLHDNFTHFTGLDKSYPDWKYYKDREERRVQSSDAVQNMIITYETAIENKCH